MNIGRDGRFLTMVSLEFTANGVEYLITGTHKIGSVYWVDYVNVVTRERYTSEHQKLCERIVRAQDVVKVPEQNKKLTKYRQTGINF